MATMKRSGSVLLEFDPNLNKLSKGKELRDGLSVVVQIGDTLWVANDETVSLERLSRGNNRNGVQRYGQHTQFGLNDFLRLPMPPPSDPEAKDGIEEVDVEGLDSSSGYLWVVGSHSLKRHKPDEEDSVAKNIKELSKVSSDGNRFLLGRIPLDQATWSPVKQTKQDGKRLTAARLRGDDKGNDLTREVSKDKLLRDFLAVPGKDNGFDIEGLAVSGSRVLLGLRGPVLRGWAVLLELELKEDKGSTLKLKRIGPDKERYRRHFLNLGGLGIRDLCVQGDDLLILAGPTVDLDGPVTVFRWPGGAQPEDESFIFAKDLPVVLDLPYGKGTDHAEGLTLFSSDGGESRSLLVVYDSAAPERQKGKQGVEADIFDLPI
jgi:Protein of unknown function (DUF3616)